MTKDQVLGLVVGCAVGDALGAPYEFMHPDDIATIYENCDMIAGGAHDVSIGEWTDDTALMLATADAYIKRGGLDTAVVAANFKAWADKGTFGTRDYVFDIGSTTDLAIAHMDSERPYAGKATSGSSGNGSLMRIAPAIAANHNNEYAAIGDAVALALMTHGNTDTVQYISAFVAEVFNGKLPHFRNLRRWDVHTTHGTGSIMHSYNVAWYALHYGDRFEGALIESIKLGYDTDTNAAITGMLAGARYGYSSIPPQWLESLQQHDYILSVATELYEIGERACSYKTFTK
jgi:ADP-ribosyl-[dinitrogen reductase] hydrolase